MVLKECKIAGNQRKQIRWFGKGVLPPGKMPVTFQRFCFNKVAVREKHRVSLPVRYDGRCIAGQNVRTVDKIGDLPEAFRLALCTEIPAGTVQPLKRGVFLRSYTCFNLKDKRLLNSALIEVKSSKRWA